MAPDDILHYRIIETLGNQPDAFLAEDTTLRRRVVLRSMKDLDGSTRERTLREARAATRLSHPNVAAIHSIEEGGGRTFIVTEHVEGETLHELMRKGAPEIGFVFDVASQILGALSGAHETSVVHGRLSPHCIVVSGSGRVKVTGFGPAVAWGPVGAASEYRPPELTGGGRIDHRGDIYSFGVVLREMLAERASADVQAIVDRCLRADCDARYQGAVEVEAALARARRRLGV